MKILLVPLTRPFTLDYMDYWVEVIRESLSKAGLESTIHVWSSVEKPPMECYVWSRRQYLSPCLISWLYSRIASKLYYYVVGIGYLDAYEEGLNFVFGEALPLHRTAIVYTKRLTPEFYGGKPDTNLYIERVAKEIIHELGHLLGLGHCSNSACVMRFSNSVYEEKEKTRYFCRKCSTKLLEKQVDTL